MAYSTEQWERARAYFEAGQHSLSQIQEIVGISKSKISEKSKKEQWEKGEDIAGLVSQAEEAIKSMIPVVLDCSTTKPIRDALKGNRNVLFLGRPNPDQDLLLFFHDQFLLLWNRLALLREKQADASSTKK